MRLLFLRVTLGLPSLSTRAKYLSDFCMRTFLRTIKAGV